MPFNLSLLPVLIVFQARGESHQGMQTNHAGTPKTACTGSRGKTAENASNGETLRLDCCGFPVQQRRKGASSHNSFNMEVQ